MNYVNNFYRCENTGFAFWYPVRNPIDRGSLSQKCIYIVTLTYIISFLIEIGGFCGEIHQRSIYLVVRVNIWPRHWIVWGWGNFATKSTNFDQKSNLNELECFSLKWNICVRKLLRWKFFDLLRNSLRHNFGTKITKNYIQ